MKLHSSLIDGILSPMHEAGPGAQREIVCIDDASGESRITYIELTRLALKRCAALQALDVRPNDLVMLAYPASIDYLALLLGCLLAGAVPCTIPMPGLRIFDTKNDVLDVAFRLYRPKVIFSPDTHVERLQAMSAGLGVRVLGNTVVGEASESGAQARIARRAGSDPHHVQLTSGSVSYPKAAVLSHRNVLDNIHGTMAALSYDPEVDGTALWLPLHHDMGLISMLVTYHAMAPILLMQPMGFIRNPLGWLKQVAKSGMTITVAPTFALRYCVRRHNPERMQGVDLSGCRSLLVGAERVDEETLQSFARTFAPYGFRGSALQPCYGMAESTLAVTMQVVSEQPGPPPAQEAMPFVVADHIDVDALAEQRIARPVEAGGAKRRTSLSCGKPLAGMEVAIRDSERRHLGERQVGEVAIRGTSIMTKYLPNPRLASTSVVDAEGWLATGDIGYLAGGHLFVLGREKEIIIIRGCNYFPHEIEEVLEEHPSVSRGTCAAVGVHDGKQGTEALVALVEMPPEGATSKVQAELQTLLAQRVGFAAHALVFVRPGALPRTTSGKMQRLKCRDMFVEGAFLPAGEVTLPATRGAGGAGSASRPQQELEHV